MYFVLDKIGSEKQVHSGHSEGALRDASFGAVLCTLYEEVCSRAYSVTNEIV